VTLPAEDDVAAAPDLLETTDVASLPTMHATFRVVAFGAPLAREEHVALVLGDVAGEDVLARVHSACLTGDVFGSARCDCGPQLDLALAEIAKAGRGVLLYLNQEGRGIGLANKIRAYALQETGLDTVKANESLGFPGDLRQYDSAVAMLRRLGVASVRLMTNNPAKVLALEQGGIRVAARVPHVAGATEANRAYLAAKRALMGHLLD